MIFYLELLNEAKRELFEGGRWMLKKLGRSELIEPANRLATKLSPDGYLRIVIPDGTETRYVCEANPRVDSNALATIVKRLRGWTDGSGLKPLLIAPHVNELVGERLRDEGIDYLDMAGNVYLRADPHVYIWLQGSKPATRLQRPSRAFQTAGLQLIALLLSRQNAIELPYRELASSAGLSLGSVSMVLSDLRSLGFIRLVAPGKNALVNGAALLEHWQFGYATRLRPKLRPRYFRLADKSALQTLPGRIPKEMTDEILIGGELAAAILTGHLRPQAATLHIQPDLSLSRVVEEMGLIPDDRGNIVLMDQFGQTSAWAREHQREKCLIHPLLVYGEVLRGMPDDRLKETASLIFDQYLAPIIHDATPVTQ